MACIGILRRTPLVLDEERIVRAFVAGAGAIGPDGAARTHWVLDSGGGNFHVELGGMESLDCHVYPARMTLRDDVEDLLGDRGEMRSAYLAHRAHLYVESSPVEMSIGARRRVARAVAELLDDETLLLWDAVDERLALCWPQTADMLRSEDPACAFAGGVDVGLC